jgi:hypothetical protein
MLDKQIVFNEIYDIFGKNLIDDGFQSNKNKNIYKYISNFGILIFDVKFTKGKVIHLNFSFSERSLELIFLEIENEYRVLQNLPKLDTRKITRPVISISDWSDLLVSNGYDYKEFNSWIEFIYAISDIKRIKPTYDVIYQIIKNIFINKVKSKEDLYNLISKKLYKNSSDYIYMLIIAKFLGNDLTNEYLAIKQDEDFFKMIPVFKAEVEFAYDYLSQSENSEVW